MRKYRWYAAISLISAGIGVLLIFLIRHSIVELFSGLGFEMLAGLVAFFAGLAGRQGDTLSRRVSTVAIVLGAALILLAGLVLYALSHWSVTVPRSVFAGRGL